MKPSPTNGQYADVIAILRKRLLRLTTALVLIWLVAVWWGERGIFKSAVAQCEWQNWERWPTEAAPHHVLLIADPQLVDPHTYPGRPWPLSSLTIYYTDLYLRRAYHGLQYSLQPDSTLFLGDLFDGGREWSTGAKYSSPEEMYKGYGQNFWLKEYRRFSKLFLRDWYKGRQIASTTAAYGRQILASVPGNHDLGFASGINPQVKARFDAYFGPMNRVDVLGNHSFVSLDTVSLSAMDEIDPKTGAHGSGDGSAAASASSHLWRPVEDFLVAAKGLRHKAVQREWAHLQHGSRTSPSKMPPELASVREPVPKLPADRKLEVPSSQFPSVVLSHVPLFRPKDTPCGPMREGRPSISLSAGYQYQNVLTPLISGDIIKHLVPEEIVGIYSGDDHDYCEVQHTEYTGAVKEITVKSMSWAMGIRKPGVQLLSLWNPIDIDRMAKEAVNNPGRPVPTPKDTLQNQLCLLPDQLTIFIRYGQLLLLTLTVLAVSAFRTSHAQSSGYRTVRGTSDDSKSEPLLPLSHSRPESDTTRSTTCSSIHPNGGNPAASSPSSRKATSSPAPPISSSHDDDDDHFAPAPHAHFATDMGVGGLESDDWGMPRRTPLRKLSRRERVALWGSSVWEVAWPVLAVYAWFLWRDRG